MQWCLGLSLQKCHSCRQEGRNSKSWEESDRNDLTPLWPWVRMGTGVTGLISMDKHDQSETVEPMQTWKEDVKQ